jgi:hypothetical protein
MTFRRALFLLSLVTACAACHDAPKPPEPLGGPIPAQICAEVKKALDAVSAQGGAEFTDKGEGTIEHPVWLAMGPDQRDSVARALAFRAGCVSGRQSKEQEVTIRGEDGMVQMHRYVSTRIDPQSLLQDGGG